MEQRILFKHMGSSAADAMTAYSIDPDKREVQVTQTNQRGVPFFSSTLLINLVQGLVEDGIGLVVDDATSWAAQAAPWRMYVQIDAQRYEARFYRQILDKSLCVELWPMSTSPLA